MTEATVSPSQRAKRPWPLLLMLLVSVVPLLLAMLSYFSGIGAPAGRVNQGQLVLQQPPLQSWQLKQTDGQRWQGEGQWQLLLVTSQCQQICQRWRHQLRQLKKALGRDRNRIQPHVVTSEPALDPQALTSEQLESIPAGIWLADPLGNLVLRYSFEQTPQAILKDLKRLLRVSKVG